MKQCLSSVVSYVSAGLVLFPLMSLSASALGQGTNASYGPTEAGSASRRAIASTHQAVDLLPEDDRIFRQAAEDFRAGRLKEALARLKEGLKASPNSPPMHHLTGLILSQLGQAQEALLHLERAVKLWPDHPVYWINLGIFYMRASRIAEADKALRRSLDISPSPTAYNLLGLIRLDQNAGEEAVELFQKSLDLAPRDVRSWYYMGLAHQSLFQSDSALACYQEALRRDGGDFHTHLQLGKVYLTRGERQQALTHLQAAQGLRPDNPEIYPHLSVAYMGTGNLESALTSARRSVEMRPGERQPHCQLGIVLARVGQAEEAKKEFSFCESLPKRPEPTPLERWREISARTPASAEALLP